MRRTLIALGLSASLVSPAPSHFFDSLWHIVSALWSDSSPAHQPQSKEGCGMDPFGRCSSTTQPQTDAGCGMDPFGLCKSGS